MKIEILGVASIAAFCLAVACSSSDAPTDTRKLGDVTAAPRECDLISATAIRLATGLRNYKAYGTKMDERFESCTVTEDLIPGGERGLSIELFSPSPHDRDDLENTRVTTRATDLSTELGPGFAARRKNEKDQSIAFVYGWTPDYKRLLTINIMEGAPGRDALADATEFFRQLKPVLLTSSK
jgi:hypothetical protein